MTMTFAKKCAWRAIYFKTVAGFQCFHIGVDPNDGVTPTFFGAITIRPRGWQAGDGINGIFHRSWRVRLPVVHWASWYRRPHWFWRLAYRASQRFWHKVDGRFSSQKTASS